METVHKNQLNELMNKTFVYKNKQITLLSYKQVNSTIVISTSKQTINFLESELNQFYKDLELVTLPEAKSFKPSPQIVDYQKTEIHTKLESALSTMIDKVLENKEAIPQATALCNITNSMVNLEKQQINFLKATGKI